MMIVDTGNKQFADVPGGKAYLYQDEAFLKLFQPNSGFNCVRLSNGQATNHDRPNRVQLCEDAVLYMRGKP